MSYFKNKETLVQSVAEMLENLKPNSALTMTIVRWPLEGFSVITVTGELLEGTGKKLRTSSSEPTNTLSENTQDG